MNRLQRNIVAGLIFATILGSGAITYAASWDLDTIFSSLWVTKQKVKILAEKEKNGDTLTQEETTLLQTLKSKIGSFGKWGRGFAGGEGIGPMWMGKWGPMMDELTDAEKTALESMTDAQKQEFFEKKRIEMETKIEARETVIDKKLNDETLTDAQKVILEEIKTHRAEMKAKRAEQKAAFDAVTPILEKKKNGETLTTAEQSQLEAFQSKYPHPGKGGKHERGGKGKQFGGKNVQ